MSSSSEHRFRRTLMPCSNCREQKIKCVTSEHPPVNPCARCKKKNLACEYPTPPRIEHQSSHRRQSSISPGSANPSPPPHSNTPLPALRPPTFTRPSSASATPYLSANPPSLPYTGPPPTHMRPRYSGTNNPYPDLALQAQQYQAYIQAYSNAHGGQLPDQQQQYYYPGAYTGAGSGPGSGGYGHGPVYNLDDGEGAEEHAEGSRSGTPHRRNSPY
ncbi:hypothetical protein C8F01DRAFT_144691 [Mycena amicta]|nr:hypothetical protein C8F01DRAFT_144691 [Mycena amicta]